MIASYDWAVTRYAALLRGIGPSNPNMRNAKLRGVCEELGLVNVQTVLSSGNVVFETESTDISGLEATLESAWHERLGFNSTTIIRTSQELQDLVDSRPFGEREHGPDSYLLVTFSKSPLVVDFEFPHQPPSKDYWIVGGTERELFSVTDTTSAKTPDVMTWLEKQFGREISSRTWLTVTRILNKLSS